jgi:hypothetical protein
MNIKRNWYEFRVGHSHYLAYFLGVSNFLLLFYNFLITSIIDIPFWLFVVFSVFSYIPLATLIGKIHIKKQMKTETSITMKVVVDEIRDRFDKLEKLMEQNKK